MIYVGALDEGSGLGAYFLKTVLLSRFPSPQGSTVCVLIWHVSRG